ncbi:MAG: HAMP domain-containing protein [Planctomycetes bacterium]|nr:HAMP domain-containing protein [Planctomycetota bacterium]
MQLGRRFNIALARKISFLFGLAVLAVISVTLCFPWLQMNAQNEQAMLWQARRVAGLVYLAVDLRPQDWGKARARLDHVWPDLARELDLPSTRCVQLVSVSSPGPVFQEEAVDRLIRNPTQRYYWRRQDDSQVFRFAMAVRGADVDEYPDTLRGLIDVTLPIATVQGVWNTVATILAGASGAVLAILVFYVVTQRLVLRPVTTLREVTERVAHGDLEIRAKIETGDEFQRLADTFNDMLAHVRAAQEEQRKINRSLDIKIGELAQSNVALFESNRLKGEFLANVSHELRTPLVSIIGFAELLRDAYNSSTEVDRQRLIRFSEHILTSGRSLLDIINDLLDIAKIEAGRLELHLSDFSIADLCKELIEFVQPLADKREQRLFISLNGQLPQFHNDSGKIKQILYNLLSNAVKFTPNGGEISLSVEPAGEASVHITVRDTGPGIPPEQQIAIFEKFHQVDSSKTKEYEGTGLGLAITKELAHILGGSIALQSADGAGATFIVTLPAFVERPQPRPLIRLN